MDIDVSMSSEELRRRLTDVLEELTWLAEHLTPDEYAQSWSELSEDERVSKDELMRALGYLVGLHDVLTVRWVGER
jgi:hypothetical protein